MATNNATSLKTVTIDRGTPADGSFTISRLLDAPRELVYQAWTNPRHLAAWWGPKTFTNHSCTMDVRPGGEFHLVMRSPQGDEYPFGGIFHELTPPSRLVMTFDTSKHGDAWHRMVQPDANPLDRTLPNSRVTAMLEPEAGKTRMTIHMTFKTAAIRDVLARIGMVEGWTSSFEKLDGVLAAAGASNH